MQDGMKAPKKCYTCKYRSGKGDPNICDYFYLTNKLRGCPIDNHCKRYEKGSRLRSVVQISPPLPLSEGEKETQRYISEQKRKIAGKDGIYLPRKFE